MGTTAVTIDDARPRKSLGALDRLLRPFADVRAGEGLTALLLMVNLFLLLAGYYLLKTIREPLILAAPHGAESKSYAAGAIAGLLMILVPAYSAVASRVSRIKLINGVTAFFIVCLVAFFALSQAGVAIGVPFFVWVAIFNVMIIAQIWAFANDVYTVEQGKRLFAIVGFGASLGAIAGSFVTGQLVKQFGPYPFLLGAAVVLGVSMIVTNLINHREASAAADTPGDRAAAGGAPAASVGDGDRAAATRERGRSGFALVFADPYLLLIAFLMLTYNVVNTNGEFILSKTVTNLYVAQHGAAAIGGLDEKKVLGAFYGNYLTIVNVLAAVIQAFVVSRVFKYLGVRWALLFLPAVSLTGYVSMAVAPALGFIRGTKIAENSLDYSVQNTTRNALYLPTSREAKYKAKQANDTFFVRFGDLVSAGLVFAGTNWLGFASRQFALVNVALIVVWIALAIAIGVRFQRLAHSE